MHDTAFQIGTLAMNIYADLRVGSILEVGSQSVNGSLRENALPTTRYLGVDIEEGDGVDLVIEPGKPLPVDDDSFDLVIASSVFEHDPCFWMTFTEMCRATKDGGYIYINAPSNGVVHRYPQDNWRFYPDSGNALALWASSQGRGVSLVESFIACREKDIWNDFVAVFRKGPITKALPKVFIHEHVRCTDVMTWKSKGILSPSEQTEDMVLLNRASEGARLAQEELARTAHERDSLLDETLLLHTSLQETKAAQQQQIDEAEKLRNDLGLRASELRQRQEEIDQTRVELAQSRSEVLRIEHLLSRERAELEETRANYRALEDVLKNEKETAWTQRAELVAQVEQAQAARELCEKRLAERFVEIEALSRMLLQREQQISNEMAKVQRLREIHQALVRPPRWWTFLPQSRQVRLQARKLGRLGLFDRQSYLRKNPDVAEAGMDPLFHYVAHGIDENRQF
jgi:SAM-dependent methyltransferase